MEYEIRRSLKVKIEVSIDYITKLFKSNEKNSILVIKDQNSKIIYFKVVKKKKKELLKCNKTIKIVHENYINS